MRALNLHLSCRSAVNLCKRTTLSVVGVCAGCRPWGNLTGQALQNLPCSVPHDTCMPPDSDKRTLTFVCGVTAFIPAHCALDRYRPKIDSDDHTCDIIPIRPGRWRDPNSAHINPCTLQTLSPEFSPTTSYISPYQFLPVLRHEVLDLAPCLCSCFGRVCSG